jgi:hypothetical protein
MEGLRVHFGARPHHGSLSRLLSVDVAWNRSVIGSGGAVHEPNQQSRDRCF